MIIKCKLLKYIVDTDFQLPALHRLTIDIPASTSYIVANLQNEFVVKILVSFLPNLSAKSGAIFLILFTSIFLHDIYFYCSSSI